MFHSRASITNPPRKASTKTRPHVLLIMTMSFVVWSFILPSAANAENVIPGKISRSFDIKPGNFARNANNPDFQQWAAHKNRQQRGDNAQNRRGRNRDHQNAQTDERTQSEERLSETARQNRNQNRARNNASGRRGATPNVNGAATGLND